MSGRLRGLLGTAGRYLVLFLAVCFITTCSMMLFIKNLPNSEQYFSSAENLRQAAVYTFLNVIFLSVLFTVCDLILRYFSVTRPVRRILAAGQRIMQGDLTARIAPAVLPGLEDDFAPVIDCFNRMAEELSGIQTLRTDFIANVSHELKTPLAVLRNYGTLLSQPDLPQDKRQEYARAVIDTSGRLADLVTNILRLNKLENQQIYPDARTYDLGEQLCACLLGFETAWEQKNLCLETDLQDGVLIHADAELLSLVWNNLISNAVKFTPDGGTIGVTLHTDGDAVLVEVRDTGCGISPQVGRHIFEKFYQGDPSHATRGNGLGLALVRRVMDLTGGEITVASQVGKGSCFTVRLPKTRIP